MATKTTVGELSDALRRAPDRSALITDFDGTLSPIVEVPASAVPLPDAVATLHQLGQRYGCVAVVSGRPVAFLRDRLELDAPSASGLVVFGLYGLEQFSGGRVQVHPEALEWREVVEEAARRAEAAAPEGVSVERKGLSFTLHVRSAPQLARWCRSWAEATASTTGLAIHPGRLALELRPPVPIDKGTVVADLVEGTSAATFLGDDLGDLPAFDALDRHAAASGATVARIGVRSAEAPPELLERADLIVDGPDGALAFLKSLL
jgi:trehalose 6-phosphate phosphatase